MTQVSKIKGLKVNQILEEARKHINIDEYMPDLHDGKLPYRDYVINVGKELNNQMMIVNTLLPNELQKLVEKAEIKREDRFIKKREITMKVLPEFHKMFFESKELSSNIPIKRPYIEQNGRFHHLIRNTDSRREKGEERARRHRVHEEDKEAIYQKDDVILELKENVKHHEELEIENEKN